MTRFTTGQADEFLQISVKETGDGYDDRGGDLWLTRCPVCLALTLDTDQAAHFERHVVAAAIETRPEEKE